MPRLFRFSSFSCAAIVLALIFAVTLHAEERKKKKKPVGHAVAHRRAHAHRHVVERADHTRLVSERGRRGYIGHPYRYRGHEFERRAYYYHGHAYNRFYMGYRYHGVHLGVYAPLRYYSAGFYGWAYHPWAHPYAYAWGWGPRPWYGYYGAYFVPYPVYDSPALWLTDYAISQSLAAQYDAAAASAPPPPLGPDVAPLTPEVKQMVAAEVQNALTLEATEAQANANGEAPDPATTSIAGLLGDGKPHVFVVGDQLQVEDVNGEGCEVSDGDVLQLTGPVAAEAKDASLKVLSSKGGDDCGKLAQVTVSLEDLQEMQNHLRETIDQGLAELQSKPGQGGLPAPPVTVAVDAGFAQGAPPPEPGGEKELAGQADQPDEPDDEPAPPEEHGPAPIVRQPPQ
jgi:hypothetical protein